MDLQSYDSTVYQQLVTYPAEVMTIMDTEAQKLARTFQPEDEPMGDEAEGGGGLAVLVGLPAACGCGPGAQLLGRRARRGRAALRQPICKAGGRCRVGPGAGV